jgi:TonB-linked SusC/RagA family outer membrane protein
MRLLHGTVLAGFALLSWSELLPAQVVVATTERGSERAPSLLKRPARLDVRDVSLTVALTRLSTQSGVTVGFSPSILRSDAWIVACKCATVTVADALDRLLDRLPLRYEEREDQIVIVPVTKMEPPRVVSVGAFVPEPLRLAPINTNQRVSADSIVSGRVVDEASHLPLADARITSSTGGRTAVTDARGDFVLILSSPTATITITRIGHQPVTRQVRAGETGIVINLARVAVRLNEQVVTGVAGGSEVRAQGNAVSKVDVAEINTLAPPKDVMSLLNTSVPGVAIQSSGGAIGMGGTFRVRGTSSMALSSAPLLYIDGVRINNTQSGGAPPNFGGSLWIGGDPRFTPSRLNDLNPDDIESMEIVKGPAASTLYGTEASNGVIQVITKKGKAGRARLEITGRTGANWLPDPENLFNPVYYKSNTGTITEFNVLKYNREVGFPKSIYGMCPRPFDTEKAGNCTGSVFSTGPMNAIAASLRGGQDQIQYYFSGDFSKDQGAVDYNNQSKLSTRANLTWAPGDKLTTEIGLGFTRQSLQNPNGPGQPVTATINFACVSPGCQPGLGLANGADGIYHGFGTFLLPERLQNDQQAHDDVDREMINLTATLKPVSWWTNRLALGGDFTQQRLTSVVNTLSGNFRNGVSYPNGLRALYFNNANYRTVDYSSTATLDRGALGTASSFGFQYFARQTNILWSEAENLALSALTTIDAGATKTTGEDYIENKSVGMYFQEQLSWNRRLYLTAAMRGDDNSAFGKDFKFVVYPKVSGSWVISEEPWLKLPYVTTAKLRAAWGKAGQQPDAYTALQTYRPRTGEGGVVGLTTDNLGNPDLKPEVGRELELGLDVGLFGDWLGLELSHYNKRTSDAIVPINIAPSLGFTGVQLSNLGGVENTGWEVAANARLYRGSRATVALRSALSVNHNKVLSTGPSANVPLSFNQYFISGYPLASFFFRRVVSSTLTNGVATNVMCEGGDVIPGTGNLSAGGGAPMPCASAPQIYAGSPVPVWQGSTSSTISLGSSLQLYANVEYLGGNMQRNSEASAAVTSFGNSLAYLQATDPILMGIAAITFDSRAQIGAFKMGYARLRELAATYTFPQRVARQFGLSTASSTLAYSGNIWTFWYEQRELFGRHVNDPSIRESGLFRAGFPGGLAGQQQDAWPTLRRLVLTMRIVP